MHPPNHIVAAAIIGTPLTHGWDAETATAIRHPLADEHLRLSQAFWRTNERAALALAMALAEWSVWRFEGLIDIADALARIEAGYAGVIDATYANIPQPERSKPTDMTNAYGPVNAARRLCGDAYGDYTSAKHYRAVNGWAFRMALLARHVVGNESALERWLSSCLRRCAEQYPEAGQSPIDQPPVPRAFFDPEFTWSGDAVRQSLNSFLAKLDPTKNPYLRRAEDM